MATISGTQRDERLVGTAFEDVISGEAGDDTLVGKGGEDSLFGGNGGDRLRGKDGNDLLDGGEGDDRLNGGAGDDILIDGLGSDRLKGGIGADRFQIGLDGSKDVIRDYEVGIDVIDLKGLSADQVANIAISTLKPGKVEILHGGDRLIVKDKAGLLTAEDLMFQPIASDDTVTTEEGTPVLIDVLANDFGAGLTLASLDTGSTSGSVSITADGQVNYNPSGTLAIPDGASVLDSFGYTVVDQFGVETSGTVSVTVDGVNVAPVTNTITATTTEDDPITIDLASGVDDPDFGEVLTFDVALVDGVSQDGQFVTIDPTVVFNALGQGETDSLSVSYTVTDASGAAADGAVEVEITGVNDAPIATNQTDRITVNGTSITVVGRSGTLDAFDPEGDVLIFSSDDSDLGPKDVINEDGTYSIALSARPGSGSSKSITWTATDQFGATDTATLVVGARNTALPPEPIDPIDDCLILPGGDLLCP